MGPQDVPFQWTKAFYDQFPEDLCERCGTWHDSGPLEWLSCPACRDPETCPHPSVQVFASGADCDACGASWRHA